jgi:predicted Rossmann-fold nucleotide-binding protein
MKKMFLSNVVQRCLKGIYFLHPSLTYGDFFSHEDRSLLHDLAKFAIPVFWVDKTSGTILQYVPKPDKDTGMFVPLARCETFVKMTSFGIYGSNLIDVNLEAELMKLLQSLNEMRYEMDHVLFNKDTPLGLVTGGGPGVMEMGNRVAKALNILSCANIVDFRAKKDVVINEQKQNAYIEAKMTYRLDRLVERQAEFNLDFPIFLMGGIGTDFEYCLEELRRKVGTTPPNPVLLFGEVEYWKEKISSRFQKNLITGTIAGSEWVGNCFFCVQNAMQALHVYHSFFRGTLKLGKNGPVYKDGFVIV